LAHAIRASQTDLKIKFHAVDPHTSLTWQKGFKVDDFYAARSRTIPPLAWPNIAPPFSPGFVRVTVADTGAGLAHEIAGQLFQAFLSTKSEGMGLGLSICRTIVEAHGGRIWAESQKPGGTRFHFTLIHMATEGSDGG
jgi:signal transduction histidine kinase